MKTYLSFTDTNALVDRLISVIDAFQSTPDLIVGVSRGGLVPATMLSHHYQARLFPLQLSTRDHIVAADDFEYVKKNVDGYSNILIVDEIADSGDTITELRILFDNIVDLSPNTNYQIATLMQRHSCTNMPDFAAQQLDNDCWVVFPWEREND